MARKPGFKVTKTDRGWKVEVPSQYSSTKKRERTFFPTRDAANKFASKLRESVKSHGENAVAIKPSLAEEAIQAQDLLKDYGISILEAARRIVEIEKANAASKDVFKATQEFQLTKETKGESQRRAYEQMSLALSRDFEGRTLASITPEELLEHVESHTGANSTFNSRATSLKTFWKWCSLTPRNWCNPKVTEILEKRETRKNSIEVLDERKCRSLLQAAEQHFPECVPAFAISLFTGMRRAEIERLEPEDFKPNGISLLAGRTKTGTRRFIEMPPPLAAWLAAYPISDTILPANWHRKEKAVRRQAGWRVWCDLFHPHEADPDLPDSASFRVRSSDPALSLAVSHNNLQGGKVIHSSGKIVHRMSARNRFGTARRQLIELAACWAHARRKLHDALDSSPRLAGWLLRQLGHLYAVEARLRENRSGPNLREAIRSNESRPAYLRIGKALTRLRKRTGILPKSPLGITIRYILDLWPRLGVFLCHGRVEIDTNLTENAIRPSAVGKKNWLFVGSEDGGWKAAVFYTLIANCRLHGIDPHGYFKNVLERLPSSTNHQLPGLLPANWAKRNCMQAAG